MPEIITHGTATHTSLDVPLLREASRSGRSSTESTAVPCSRHCATLFGETGSGICSWGEGVVRRRDLLKAAAAPTFEQ
jgi:hypothetical protein